MTHFIVVRAIALTPTLALDSDLTSFGLAEIEQRLCDQPGLSSNS